MPVFSQISTLPPAHYAAAQSATLQKAQQVIPSHGAFDSLAALSHKTYENIEEGGGYNSDGDKYSRSSKSSPPPTSALIRRGRSGTSDMGRKRSASVYEEDNALTKHKRVKFTSASTPIPKQSVYLRLPVNLWADIFALLHPADLGRQRRTCKLFQKTLDDQRIWQKSRERHLPDHPSPVFGLTEWEMLCVMWGSGCMLCEKGSNRRMSNAKPIGIKETAAIYWPFRVRCCKECLEENTTKEFALLSSTSFPVALLPVLPFGIVDLRNNWISNPTHYQPNIGLTKVFWNADIGDILERYQEATEMRAQEKWLKDLEEKGLAHNHDVTRIEKFEKLKTSGNIVLGVGLEGTPEIVEIESQSRQQQHGLPQKTHGDYIKERGPIKHPHQHHSNSINDTAGYPQTMSSQPRLDVHRQSFDGPRMSRNTIQQQFDIPQGQTSVQMEQTPHEVTGAKARCRSGIKARCLRIVPSLKPELLLHIPEFALPLTDRAWETSDVKLLEQVAGVEEQGCLKQVECQKLQHYEERKVLEQKQKESKERKEREWDDFQAPVRERLGLYADEIINRWVGGVTKETAPKFAADVLDHCRRRFYEEKPYSADDPYHINPLDTTTRAGQATLEVPTARRLTLENMKFVFDNKIRPSTEHFGRELFLCNGCEYNPKFYAFEGVIQHYAAKHTSQLSVGQIVVHWKADWPAKPPFNLDPLAASMVLYQGSGAFRASPIKMIDQRPSYPFFRGAISHQPPSHYGYTPVNLYTPVTAFGPAANAHYIHPSQLQQTQIIQSKLVTQAHPVYLGRITKDAREAWFQLSGIKDLPSSVRVYYVISRTVSNFQASFSCELPLTLFIEALKEYPSLKPMKNANGLLCLQCHKNPPPPAPDGTSRIGRLFTLSALLQHFQAIHVLRSKATVKPDWRTEMVKLPETRLIGMIRQAQGMDEDKYKLLKDVFRLAFSLPLPGKSFNKATNHAVHAPTLEGPRNRSTSPNRILASEQKDTQPSEKILQICAPLSVSIAEDYGHHSRRTPTDHCYLTRSLVDPLYGLLEPRSWTTRESLNETTGLGAPGSNDCSHPSRPPSTQSELGLRQPSTRTYLARSEHTMNAAERFLENFLRDTSDALNEKTKGEDKELFRSPPRAPTRNRQLSPSSTSLENQGGWAECSHVSRVQNHYSPEIRVNPDRLRKYNHETAPMPLDTERHSQYAIPPPPRYKDKHGHNGSRSYEKFLINDLPPRCPSVVSERLEGRSRTSNHNLNDNQFSEQPLPYSKEKPSNYLHDSRNDMYYDEKYPTRLARDQYNLKDHGTYYRDTYWSHKPPVVSSFPQIQSASPAIEYSESQYEVDYRGRVASRGPLPPVPYRLAQYSRYLPLKLPGTKATCRRRSTSPAPVIRRFSENVAMSSTSLSAPLPKGFSNVEDNRKIRGEDSDRGYYQLQREERGPVKIVWGRTRAMGRGRGRGRGRGFKMSRGKY